MRSAEITKFSQRMVSLWYPYHLICPDWTLPYVIFFSFIEDTIKKYNVPRDLFIIEITETMLQKDDYHINR